MSAWSRLKKRKGSHGIDNEMFEDFQRALDRRISETADQLRRGTFRFQALRPVAIPKKHKRGLRPLLVPTIRDRVVHRAILDAVYPCVRPRLPRGVSHAFLSNRGVKTAARAVKRNLASGRYSVITTDIVDFFPNIVAANALERIYTMLPDESLRPLLNAFLSWEVDGVERLKAEHRACFPGGRSVRGIPQGLALLT
jgi:retron-type reverse transcriptase